MTEPPMVSYAQNGEDVVLRRAFTDRQGSGFYVDIGACHPEEDSVTHHFYERGWRGINVEPDPDLFELFVEARGGDMNVNAAVGAERGRAAFFPIGIRGHGTLDGDSAARRHADERALRVPVMTLGDILDMYGPDDGHVDFLKVDVEGWEERVLRDVDWSRHRPVVVLVEAVDPQGVPTHADWEAGLLAGGYRFALFDGLNRFYCRDEDADRLLPLLASPAGVLDHWVRKSEDLAVAEAARRSLEAAQATARQASLIAQHAAEHASLVAQHAAECARLQQISDRAELRSTALGLEAEEARHRTNRTEADLAEAKTRAASLAARSEEIGVDLGRARNAAMEANRREEAVEAALAEAEMKVQIMAEMSRVNESDLKRAIDAIHAEEIDNAAHADRAEQARAALGEESARHADEIAALHRELARLTDWREAIRRSTSWRITRPLRAVVRAMKGGSRVD